MGILDDLMRHGAVPSALQGEAPFSLAGPGLLDRLSKVIAANPMTLTTLGAGIAEGGIGKGLELAAHGQKYDRENRQQDLNHTATVQALRGKGVPDVDIAAALHSPIMMKALIGKYYAKDANEIPGLALQAIPE